MRNLGTYPRRQPGFGHFYNSTVLKERRQAPYQLRLGYTAGMLVVVTSALTFTTWRIFFDPNRTQNSIDFSVFLFFIAIFSLATLQQGLVVIRHKKRTAKIETFQTLALPIALTIIAITTLILGMIKHKFLFVIFSALGIKTGWEQIGYWRQPQVYAKDWFFAHLNNMFVCCIATVTAFTVTALPRILADSNLDSIWVWLAPTFIIVPWMKWFERRYHKSSSQVPS